MKHSYNQWQKRLSLTTLTPLLLVVLLATPVKGVKVEVEREKRRDSGIGNMAIPMALFTGAGLYDWRLSTGVTYGFGGDGSRTMQNFGYSFLQPWEAGPGRLRTEFFWAVPFSWWEYDVKDEFARRDYPSLGLQLMWQISDHFYERDTPNTGWSRLLPSGFGIFGGASYSLAREQVEANVGISLVRWLW